MSDLAVRRPQPDVEMTHREIVEVLVGLMSALFVAVVSATIVSTALPTIIADLNGSQTQYTWVVTASLLAMTVSSPIWSKLSDLFNKKLLVQVAIVVFLRRLRWRRAPCRTCPSCWPPAASRGSAWAA